jgi:ATP-dependent RNA helicase MRH4
LTEAVRTNALSDLETVEPTPVQKLAIPAILGGGKSRRKVSSGKAETFLIAAETGSGKTLAYVLPILDQLKRDEEVRKLQEAQIEAKKEENSLGLELPTPDEEVKTRPKAVILVPTAELVNQVGRLLKSLSHLVKFRAALISREYSATVIRSRLFASQPDIVVSTPHLLDSLTATNPAILSECSHVVVDEADSLYDRSFSPITTALVKRAYNLKCLVLCSATIPRSLDTRIRDLYPDAKRLVTPNLHAIPRRVQLSLVDIEADPYRGNKRLACADTLYNIAKDGSESGYVKKVIVFVNERDMTEEVASYLSSKKIDAVAFARDTTDRQRSTLLDEFTGPKKETEAKPDSSGKLPIKVLVTTDISSRGIDTKTVKNVVLFDVPHSSIDFIHRLGRTGRMGRRGKAVVLVDKNTNKGWVKDIKRYEYSRDACCSSLLTEAQEHVHGRSPCINEGSSVLSMYIMYIMYKVMGCIESAYCIDVLVLYQR